MQTETQVNELRVYMVVQSELRDAIRRQDKEAAMFAIEELLCMEAYSSWARLRARCAATIAEFQ